MTRAAMDLPRMRVFLCARTGRGAARRPLAPEAAVGARSAPAGRPAGTGGAGAGRVVRAMLEHPEYVAGSGRLCMDLVRATGGRVFAKIGAEGVYAAGVATAGLGVALKVEDGARRAVEPALVAVLAALGVLSEAELGSLERYARPAVTNTRGETVGAVVASVELEKT